LASPLRSGAVSYWSIIKTDPRPLRVHHLKIELANPGVEVGVVLARLPPTEGTQAPTASLESPLSLARRSGAIALVNANFWMGAPDAHGQRSADWHEDMPVQILGLAVARGEVRCPPRDQTIAFWIDDRGKPHIGQPTDLATVREGIAGMGELVRDAQVIPRAPAATPAPRNPTTAPTSAAAGGINPRTALGLDATGRYLFLVVVDGRQPGYSEGMSMYELASYMHGLGCTRAINLDGGGSSIMIVADDQGTPHVVSSPSTKVAGLSLPRPLPVALVVRARQR
jgi:hypothetical protein